ncbi:MAG: OmpA family protein [Balneolaceae bacterium]
MKKVLFYVFVCLILQTDNVYAQGLNSLVFDNSGLQIGAFRGQTNMNDSGINYSFRFLNQHLFTENRFGEISISIGSVSGRGYKSRLIPVEYRLGQRLLELGIPDPELFGKKGSVFIYAGLGVLYHKPIEITAPDDPLTEEMESGLPVSSLWDFKTGYAPFIPVGIGMDFALDNQSRLSLNLGYNKSVNALRLNENRVPNGYWAFSIGLNFKREKTPAAVYSPAPPAPPVQYQRKTDLQHTITESNIEPVNLISILFEEMSRKYIRFDNLSSIPDEEGKSLIRKFASILKFYPDVSLQVSGHADISGTDAVNQMISESRARAVWLELLDAGVDASQIGIRSYSSDRPLESNDTSDGREKNRRVAFTVNPDAIQSIRTPVSDEIFIAPLFADFEYNKPLPGSEGITFARSLLGLDDYSTTLLQLISYLMYSKPEMKLVVINQADAGAGTDLRISLAKARAEFIKADFILNGITPEKIQAAIPGSQLYEQYEHHLEGPAQQNLLIPVQSTVIGGEER